MLAIVRRFSKRYSQHLFHIILEEYLGWIVRSLPGFVGIGIRWLAYRMLFQKLDSFAFIYAGVYLSHTYGIRTGKSLAINSGALLDGRGGITLGNNVLIGPYAVIASSNHDYKQVDLPLPSVDHIIEPVTIGDDVWIGAHAVITGGLLSAIMSSLRLAQS